MSNELEAQLRAALAPVPDRDPELERATLLRVRDALPRPRPRRRRVVITAAQALAVATAAGLLILALPRGGDEAGVAPGDEPAPAPSGVLTVAGADPATGLFDPRTAIADLRGRVVVMAFVARGCASCADVFGNAATAYAGRVTFVQVLADATAMQGRRIAENRLPAAGLQASPTALDTDGALTAQLRVTARPTVVVLGKDGREAARFTHAAGEDLTRVLPGLVRAAAPAGFPRPRQAALELGVFETAPADPATVSRLPMHVLTDTCQVIPGHIWLAARGPLGARTWVARTMDGSLATASTYGRGGQGGGVGCGTARYEADRQEVLRRIRGSGIVSVESYQGRSRWGVAIVVLDRWTELRIAGQRIPIRTNGAITTGPGRLPATAVLTGPGGSRTIRFAR